MWTKRDTLTALISAFCTILLSMAVTDYVHYLQLSPAMKTKADKIEDTLSTVMPGDIVRKGEETYVADKCEDWAPGQGSIMLLGPGPQSNPSYGRTRIGYRSTDDLYDLCRDDVSVLRKGQPGYLEEATFFYLQ